MVPIETFGSTELGDGWLKYMTMQCEVRGKMGVQVGGPSRYCGRCGGEGVWRMCVCVEGGWTQGMQRCKRTRGREVEEGNLAQKREKQGRGVGGCYDEEVLR